MQNSVHDATLQVPILLSYDTLTHPLSAHVHVYNVWLPSEIAT